MIYKSPALADALIMDKARRPGTPGNLGLIPAHAARQYADTAQTEGYRQNLDMANKRLAENSRQFNENMGFQRSLMRDRNRQGNWATGLSALGLGVGLGGIAKQNRQAMERMASMDKTISILKKRGDSEALMWASMMENMKNGY